MDESRHVVKEVLGAVFIGEQCWPLPPICDRKVDNDDGLFRIAVGAGGVHFRDADSGRTSKSRGSTTTYLEFRLDEIANVRLPSLGERQILAIIPRPECAARLAELSGRRKTWCSSLTLAQTANSNAG